MQTQPDQENVVEISVVAESVNLLSQFTLFHICGDIERKRDWQVRLLLEAGQPIVHNQRFQVFLLRTLLLAVVARLLSKGL